MDDHPPERRRPAPEGPGTGRSAVPAPPGALRRSVRELNAIAPPLRVYGMNSTDSPELNFALRVNAVNHRRRRPSIVAIYCDPTVGRTGRIGQAARPARGLDDRRVIPRFAVVTGEVTGESSKSRKCCRRARGARCRHVGEVSTRERLPGKPAFDLAPPTASGLYLSASAQPFHTGAHSEGCGGAFGACHGLLRRTVSRHAQAEPGNPVCLSARPKRNRPCGGGALRLWRDLDG